MSGRVKILSVDDSRIVRIQVQRAFQNYDIEFLEAEHGEEGLEMANKMPDLILLDITMPVMDGLTMLAKLRERPEHKNTPVIMVSAELNQKSMIKMAQKGSNDYLPKPFQPEELLAKSKALLKDKLIKFDDKVARIKTDEADEMFYIKDDHLVLNIPNLEPDVIMNIAAEFPLNLEESVRNKAENVFINLSKLNNIDVVTMTCLNGIISATKVRGIRCHIFADERIRKQMDIYPGTDQWDFYEEPPVDTLA